MKYIATFTPQAWVNDYAIEVDPQGEATFDVTDEMLAIPESEREPYLQSNSYESDEFQHARNAPQWVKDWSGPFYVTVHEIEGEPK